MKFILDSQDGRLLRCPIDASQWRRSQLRCPMDASQWRRGQSNLVIATSLKGDAAIIHRHCEERSDAAIYLSFMSLPFYGLLRCPMDASQWRRGQSSTVIARSVATRQSIFRHEKTFYGLLRCPIDASQWRRSQLRCPIDASQWRGSRLRCHMDAWQSRL